MYIRACSVSYTGTLSEFPKGGKKSEEHCHMPRPAGGKLFLHAHNKAASAATHRSKYRGSTHCFPHGARINSGWISGGKSLCEEVRQLFSILTLDGCDVAYICSC